MFISYYKEVEAEKVNDEGAKNVFIQWLIPPEKAKNFAMRRFIIKKGGHTPLHKHDWEHEIFVLNGKGALVDENGNEHPLNQGNFAFVEPNELHQFKNVGDDDFIFLCLIPI